jgi:hypothetical protein
MGNEKQLIIAIPDGAFVDALGNEMKAAIERVLAADGIVGTNIRNDIVNAAVEKLTSWDNVRYQLDEIIKKFIIDKAFRYLIVSDDGFKKKYEYRASFYERENQIPEEMKIGLYFEYMIEKLIRDEVESRLHNLEISMSKHARAPEVPPPKPIAKK